MADSVKMGKYTVEIDYDEFPSNPRDNYNVGRLLCAHGRYKLGDDSSTLGFTFRSEDFESWDEIEEWLTKEQDAYLTVPISMTDHSGLHIHAGRVRDWDSGQIGFAYVTNTMVEQTWPDLSGQEKYDAIHQHLVAEINEYGDYVSGNVWAYRVLNEEGEEVAGCSGFIGSEGKAEAMREALLEIKFRQSRDDSKQPEAAP